MNLVSETTTGDRYYVERSRPADIAVDDLRSAMPLGASSVIYLRDTEPAGRSSRSQDVLHGASDATSAGRGWTASTVRSVSVDPKCIFCGIVAGEIPSTTIAETERAVAFMDINPATHGHALVIPRAHATDLLDIAAEDLAACAHLAQEIAGRAKDRLGADGVNLLNCCGVDAWQSVFHFHFHVIPRFKDQPDKDSIRLPWDPVPGNPEEIGQIGNQLS